MQLVDNVLCAWTEPHSQTAYIHEDTWAGVGEGTAYKIILWWAAANNPIAFMCCLATKGGIMGMFHYVDVARVARAARFAAFQDHAVGHSLYLRLWCADQAHLANIACLQVLSLMFITGLKLPLPRQRPLFPLSSHPPCRRLVQPDRLDRAGQLLWRGPAQRVQECQQLCLQKAPPGGPGAQQARGGAAAAHRRARAADAARPLLVASLQDR